jgi:hypothetical protein
LASIRPRDFIEWNSSKDKVLTIHVSVTYSHFSFPQKTDCPALYSLTQHFNRLAYWVVSEIVIRVRKSERVSLLEKFINIASLSLHINNFFGAKALFTGIVHPAVSRMTSVLIFHLVFFFLGNNLYLFYRPFRRLVENLKPGLLKYIAS